MAINQEDEHRQSITSGVSGAQATDQDGTPATDSATSVMVSQDQIIPGSAPFEVVSRIERLRSEGAQVDDLLPVVRLLLSHYSKSTGSELHPGQKFYRTTKHHISLPARVSDVSYPPSSVVKNAGRCNRIGQSMFYCGGSPDCAIELQPQAGSFIVIGEWQLKESLIVIDLGYSAAALQRAGSSRPLQEFYNTYFAELSDTEKFVHQFIALAFMDPTDKQYALTTAIAEIYSGPSQFPLAGLIYPSVEFSCDLDNVVIKPSVADSSLQLVSARALQVEDVRHQSFKATLVATVTAVSSDGTLKWQPEGEAITVPVPSGDITLNWDGKALRIFNTTEIGLEDRRYFVQPGFQIELSTGVVRNAQGEAIEGIIQPD